MATFTKFHVAGGIEDARSVMQDVLGRHGYRFSWDSPHSGLAEKGSKVKAMLLGAFAIHYKYTLQFEPGHDQTIVASVSLGNTGVAGGAIGFGKVRSELDTLSGDLRQAFESKGLLRHAEVG